MRALTIRQPYAALIADGIKSIEVRSWRTSYRGPLLICASARPADVEEELTDGRAVILPAGVACCVVDLWDVTPFSLWHEEAACCDWEANLYAWRLRHPRPVQPVPVKGQQRLFYPPPGVINYLPAGMDWLDAPTPTKKGDLNGI
jgi:hypothetical protein